MTIWVTGIGVVSPLGRTAKQTMDAIVGGERGFRPLTLFGLPGTRTDHAAEVGELAVDLPGLRGEEESSRTDRMAILAAREALEAAGLHDAERPVDLVVGGTTAGLLETEGYLAEIAAAPEARRPRRLMLSHPLSATIDRMRLGLGGLAAGRTVCSACSSAANAIVLAAARLSSGRSARVLAGGADGLCRLTFAGFHALGALAEEPCRPFDRRRRGLSLGEGAAFLVLETEQAARERGAEPIVELRGWAVGSECHHIANPEPGGATATRVMRRALERAALRPADIGYVNAHGTGTVLNDAMEVAALRACFGPELGSVAVSSSKGQLGHTIGAAGAIEAAITAMALVRRVLPPTCGLDDVDPACSGPRHLLAAETTLACAAMSNSFGFGGTDTALVLALPGAFAGQAERVRRRVVVLGGATVGPLGVRGTAGSLEYLAPGPAPAVGAIAFDALAHLDVERARRIDRAGRMVTVAVKTALDASGLAPPRAGSERSQAEPAANFGAVVGSAYGPVDGSAAFIQRVRERGVRWAAPAAFPNLVPSSPVAHAAIYLGLAGPVLAVSELGTTAEAAMVTAVELIEAAEAERMVAGAVEELGPIVQSSLAPLYAERDVNAAVSEGAAVVLFEAAAEAASRRDADPAARAPIADVLWAGAWCLPGTDAMSDLPAPRDRSRALVIVGEACCCAAALAQATDWTGVAVSAVASRAGQHAALGGFAVVAALAALEADLADDVLVLGVAGDRGCGLLLGSRRGHQPVERSC